MSNVKRVEGWISEEQINRLDLPSITVLKKQWAGDKPAVLFIGDTEAPKVFSDPSELWLPVKEAQTGMRYLVHEMTTDHAFVASYSGNDWRWTCDHRNYSRAISRDQRIMPIPSAPTL